MQYSRLSGMQLCWRAIALAIAIAICGDVQAQQEVRKDLVKLTSIKAAKEGDTWVISLRGKAPKLPKGTKVNFHLTWLGQSVAVFKETISGDFALELKPKKVPLTQDEFMLKTVIVTEDQTSKVKKAIAADPESFVPAGEPWTTYFFDHGVRLATPEEIAAELQVMKEFFKSRYTELAKLDKTVKDAAKAAKEGTDYDKSGSFDEKKWRKWFDKDVVERIKEVQAEIVTSHQDSRFLPHRATLGLLTEVSAGVARRSLKRQKSLYEAKEVTLSDEDDKPKDLDVDSVRRRTVSDRYLNELIQQINARLTPKKAEPAASDEKGSDS